MMCIVWSLTLLHVNALKKWILLEDPMAPVQLECSVGGECQYKTQLLEYAQADIWNLLTKQLVEAIVIESLRRPDLKLDSSFKEWSEFLMTWNQYKDEYQLAGSSLIRQLFACCAEELRHSLSRVYYLFIIFRPRNGAHLFSIWRITTPELHRKMFLWERSFICWLYDTLQVDCRTLRFGDKRRYFEFRR